MFALCVCVFVCVFVCVLDALQLFDLMIMTVKYQFTLCKQAKELLGVTLTHLETVRDTMDLDDHCKRLVTHTIHLFQDVCQPKCTHSLSMRGLLHLAHSYAT